MELIEKSYYDILEEQASAHPECDAVVMGQTRITYADFLKKIDQTATLLLNLGLKKGDKAVLWSTASPAWLYTYYGIIRAGGIAVVINANLKVADAVPLSDYSDASFLMYGPSHDIKGIGEEADGLAGSFHMNPECVLCIAEANLPKRIAADFPKTGVREDAYIIYTSGTTSFPKAVLTSQFGIINAVNNLSAAIASVKGSRGVMSVPLFHAYGLMVSWMYLSCGGTVLIPERIKAADVAELVEAENATDLWSVAVVYQSLIDDEVLSRKVAPRLHLCTIAGSYTTPVQFLRFETTLKNAIFINMYGMTETCAAYCLTRPEDDMQTRYTSIGRPIDGVEMRIWNEEKGFLPYGEVGEIITRGYNLMNSYYKLPPEKQIIDSDGWLHSGDLGIIDDKGNLHIVGRSKDLIIKGGENIAPSEIENEVLNCECIKECRVFGFRDPIYGENIGACVTLKDKNAYAEDKVRAHVKSALGTYKTPVYFLVFDEFPLNANGKVDQKKLHADMLNRLCRMELNGKLQKGVALLNLSFRNGTYCIEPIAALMEEFTLGLGFSAAKAKKIRLCTEEVLSMHVNENDKDMEDINLQMIACFDHLSIVCTDTGIEAIDTEGSESRRESIRLSAKIISSLVDDLNRRHLEDGRYCTTLSFGYEGNFSIEDFLMQHEKAQ